MSVNDVFRALADPTRREILRLLRKRDMTAGEALVRLRSDPRVRFAEPVVAPRGPP